MLQLDFNCSTNVKYLRLAINYSFDLDFNQNLRVAGNLRIVSVALKCK